ncbi:hypothetical protein [Arcanobacterium canis]
MTTPPSNNPFESDSTPHWDQTPHQSDSSPLSPPFGSYGQPQENTGMGQPYPQYSQQPAQPLGAPASLFPLRPLGVGETFDAAMRTIRFNPTALIGVPMLIWLVGLVVDSATSYLLDEVPAATTTPEMAQILDGTSMWSLLISLFIGAALVALMTGASTRAAIKGSLGRKVSFSEAAADAGRGAGKTVLHALIFQVLATVVVTTVVGLLLFATVINALSDVNSSNPNEFAAAVGAILGSFALVLLLLIALYPLYARLFVIYPVMVIERKGVFAAIARSWKLTRGSTGYLCLLGLGIIGIVIAGAVVFGLFSVILTAAFATDITSALTAALIGFISSALLSVFFVPFFLSIQAVLYINMRITREAVTPAAYMEN